MSTSLALVASDPDGDPLTFGATGLPPGLTINSATGLISGTPTTAGNYSPTVSVADDRGGSDSGSFSWDVSEPANNPPVLTVPADQNGVVGVGTNLALSASDADGDPLTYGASGLPGGLTINTTTGLISGTPTTSGSYAVSVSVADDRGGSDSGGFTWTIAAPPNTPPVLDDPGDQQGSVGDPGSLTLSGSDADGDPLTYSASGLPDGLTLNTSTGAITGTLGAAGNFTVTAGVADGRGGSDSVTFDWSVSAADNWTPIAEYGADLASTPLPGWSYLWNPSSAIGNEAAYQSLLWNGSRYDSDGDPGRPDPTELAYGLLKTSGGHPGRGTAQGAAQDRYVIAAYRVSESGAYRLVNASAQHTSCQYSSGLDLRVYVNDLQQAQFGVASQGAAVDFATDLGSLTAGDDIYVAMGPSTRDGCDGFGWNFTIERNAGAGNTNRPPVLTDPGDQSATVGEAVSLAIAGSDPDGDTLTWSMAGNPPGVTIDASSGLITGTPGTTGVFATTVSVSDGDLGDSVTFDWTINEDVLTWSPVAGYGDDFGSTPAAGWRYLWNANGALGDAANYVELAWNGSRYISASGTFPDPGPLRYGYLAGFGGHAGGGENVAGGIDRYVIAEYMVSASGDYRIAGSDVAQSGCQYSNGLDLRVLVDDVEIQAVSVAQGAPSQSFDTALGTLAAGARIHVVLGPATRDGCDRFNWDYTIERAD